MESKIQFINPDGLLKNPAFSQIVTTQGTGKTIFIGGQNAVNVNREIIGKNNIGEQVRQIMLNIQAALAFCGAAFENVVKISIAIVQGQNMDNAFREYQKFISNVSTRPAISVHIVTGLANPDFLIEIEATAFIPG